MSTTEAKIVWYEKKGESLDYQEAAIPGGFDPAIAHARVLVKEKDVLLGQILASDGLVLLNFTGCEDALKPFAN